MKNILSFVLAMVFSIASFGQASQIVITEIMYGPPNNNGGGVEYLELYNNDSVSVDMTGYFFSDGISFTFPSLTLAVGEFVLLSNKANSFNQIYGMTALEYGGSMSNNGENITLKDATGLTVDSIDYEPNDPWPSTVNGGGPSLVLCAPDADNNNSFNWQRSINSLGFNIGGHEVYGNPGSLSFCHNGPIVSIEVADATQFEFDGTVSIDIVIDNANVNTTTVDVGITSLTASTSTDVTFTPLSVSFAGSSNTPQDIQFTILNDAVFEPGEQFIITLSNPDNNAIFGTDTLVVTIKDNDGPVDASLLMVGIFDGGMNGPLGVELYARQNISDLSIFGLGSADNGNGSDGIEYTFPPISLTEGTSIFVTNDSADFLSFFGFASDFIDGGNVSAINFSGNDAFEVFENGVVIDVFGVINVNGMGQPWEYSNGWAHRVDSTGPDGDIFVLANWNFGPVGVLGPPSTNSAASVPYPIGTFDYPSSMVSINPIDQVSMVEIYPNPTKGQLIISAETRIKTIEIFDLTGRSQVKAEVNRAEYVLDISKLSKGIYTIEINGSSLNESKRIVLH
ncbi:MAG: T9SS type A sorting domain-containing protein [Chitinophagales bacterium]|nr:T9SS type A sorting domain-containing protein [Chitinophagales bacterium]